MYLLSSCVALNLVDATPPSLKVLGLSKTGLVVTDCMGCLSDGAGLLLQEVVVGASA